MATWMKMLDPTLQWTSVILPGTHDSGAYDVTYFHPMPGKEKLAFAKAVSYFVNEWTICQSHDIAGQLHMGVRCFDLRLAYDGHSVWVCHTFSCVPFQRVLDDVRHFASDNPSEMVVLRLREDYENRNTFAPDGEAAKALVTMLAPMQSMFIPARAMDYSLQQLRDIKTNVAIIWTGDAYIPSQEWLLPRSLIWGHWANTSSIEQLARDVASILAGRRRSPDVFYEISFTLTPQAEDVKEGILKQISCRGTTNLRTYAEECKQLFAEQKRDELILAANLITVDYADSSLVRAIYDLNFIRPGLNRTDMIVL